ncbi:MAG: DUF1338 domain-containing protein [Deltaproteobacteria bacterium]|nr:DUF1338 domain-containing protein [Deltaproteobacteria bacterium]
MNKISLHDLFDQLWEFYATQNPQVPEIHNLLSRREDLANLVNDHIALRTFADPRINLEILAKNFTRLGFEEQASYELAEKNVFAKYYVHPSGQWPKVFISELQLDSLSQKAQALIQELIGQIPEKVLQSHALCAMGRPWDLNYSTYQKLQQESEYAAWMSAHGFQMNHATLSVNDMTSFANLEALVSFLEENGFEMNGQDSNQEIQKAFDPHGDYLLKQASTLAAKVNVKFLDGERIIPGCYYEFIERFQGYEGFDPGNASKIMESTNMRNHRGH